MFKQILQDMFAIDGRQVQEQKKKDIFDSVYGHEDIKELLKKIMHASAPVHILLAGPPGCGKTECCKAIADYYPDTIWLEGDTVTVAGIIKQLTEKPQAKYIIYNEIADAKPAVRHALLEIMENGTVTKTNHEVAFKLHHPIWFIATTNVVSSLTKQFLNRLIVKNIAPYTRELFVQVAIFTAMRQGVSKEVAEHIAQLVLDKFGIAELRKCRDLARMGKTIADADRNVELF